MKTSPILTLPLAVIIFTLMNSCSINKNTNKQNYSDVVKPKLDILEGEHNCTINLFQGIFAENKIYISWTASTNYEGLCFLIEKSFDNKTYKPALIKIGTISPKEFDLLYCATDNEVEAAKTKQIFYRIRAIKQYEFSNNLTPSINSKEANEYPTICVSAKSKSGKYSLLKQTNESDINLTQNLPVNN
jgi:hypothetical protein